MSYIFPIRMMILRIPQSNKNEHTVLYHVSSNLFYFYFMYVRGYVMHVISIGKVRFKPTFYFKIHLKNNVLLS